MPSASELLERGLHEARVGDLRKACDILTKFVLLNPDHTEARYELGACLNRLGYVDAAREEWRRVTEAAPEHREAVCGLAILETARGGRGALGLLERLTAQHPGDPELRFNLGKCYYRLGEVDTAAREWSRALETHDHHAEASLCLAGVRLEDGDPQGAIRLLERFMEREPQHADAMTLLGKCYSVAGQLEAAEKAIRQVLALRSGHPRAGMELAALLYRQEKFPEATRILGQLAKTNPNHIEARVLFGRCLLRMGDHDAAQLEWEEAFRLNPSRLDIRDRLTELESFKPGPLAALIRGKTDDEAIAVLLDRVTRSPADADAYRLLGHLYWKQERLKEAEDIWCKAVRSGLPDPKILLRLTLLAEQHLRNRDSAAAERLLRIIIEKGAVGGKDWEYLYLIWRKRTREASLAQDAQYAPEDPICRRVWLCLGRLSKIKQSFAEEPKTASIRPRHFLYGIRYLLFLLPVPVLFWVGIMIGPESLPYVFVPGDTLVLAYGALWAIAAGVVSVISFFSGVFGLSRGAGILSFLPGLGMILVCRHRKRIGEPILSGLGAALYCVVAVAAFMGLGQLMTHVSEPLHEEGGLSNLPPGPHLVLTAEDSAERPPWSDLPSEMIFLAVTMGEMETRPQESEEHVTFGDGPLDSHWEVFP